MSPAAYKALTAPWPSHPPSIMPAVPSRWRKEPYGERRGAARSRTARAMQSDDSNSSACLLVSMRTASAPGIIHSCRRPCPRAFHVTAGGACNGLRIVDGSQEVREIGRHPGERPSGLREADHTFLLGQDRDERIAAVVPHLCMIGNGDILRQEAHGALESGKTFSLGTSWPPLSTRLRIR